MRDKLPGPGRVGAAGIMVLGLTLGASRADAKVVAVVSARNPVAALSKSQLVDIFLGRATRFPDGSEAVPVDQGEGSAERDEFYLTFAGKSPAQLKAYWSKLIFTGRGQPPRGVANAAAVKQRLLENPKAVGYIEESDVDSSVRVVLSP